MKTDNFKEDQIAPCGANCMICMGFLKSKKNCPGCRKGNKNKPNLKISPNIYKKSLLCYN